MGLIRYKTESPAGAPHDDATIWNGPGGWSALTGRFFWNHFPMALPWAASALPLRGGNASIILKTAMEERNAPRRGQREGQTGGDFRQI